MIDMDLHARHSTEVRRAADLADGLAKNLRKLNDGPVFDHERAKLIGEVDAWFVALSEIIGKRQA